MSGRRVSIALAALTLARVAGAQENLAIAGADRETIAQLAQIVATTTGRGLPVDQVIGEARFAALNRAPGPKIVFAARDVAARLEEAREALAPEPSARDIEAGADALKYKIPRETLRRIRAARAGRAVAVHLGLLIQLVSTNVSVERAEKTVLELIKRNAKNEHLADLGNAVNLDVRRGRAPDDALDQQFKKLNALLGNSPGTAAADAAITGATSPKKP